MFPIPFSCLRRWLFNRLSVDSSLILFGISFQALLPAYWNPFLENSSFTFGICRFLSFLVLQLDRDDLNWNIFHRLSGHSLLRSFQTKMDRSKRIRFLTCSQLLDHASLDLHNYFTKGKGVYNQQNGSKCKCYQTSFHLWHTTI